MEERRVEKLRRGSATVESLQTAARSYKATTSVVCDGFRPRVLSDFSKATLEEVEKYLDKTEQCGTWPQQSCEEMFLLIPKSITSERPLAQVPSIAALSA